MEKTTNNVDFTARIEALKAKGYDIKVIPEGSEIDDSTATIKEIVGYWEAVAEAEQFEERCAKLIAAGFDPLAQPPESWAVGKELTAYEKCEYWWDLALELNRLRDLDILRELEKERELESLKPRIERLEAAGFDINAKPVHPKLAEQELTLEQKVIYWERVAANATFSEFMEDLKEEEVQKRFRAQFELVHPGHTVTFEESGKPHYFRPDGTEITEGGQQ